MYHINKGVHWMLHAENKSNWRASKIIPQYTLWVAMGQNQRNSTAREW